MLISLFMKEFICMVILLIQTTFICMLICTFMILVIHMLIHAQLSHLHNLGHPQIHLHHLTKFIQMSIFNFSRSSPIAPTYAHANHHELVIPMLIFPITTLVTCSSFHPYPWSNTLADSSWVYSSTTCSSLPSFVSHPHAYLTSHILNYPRANLCHCEFCNLFDYPSWIWLSSTC